MTLITRLGPISGLLPKTVASSLTGSDYITSVAATMCYKCVLLDKVLKQSHELIHNRYPERSSLGDNEKPDAACQKGLDARCSLCPLPVLHRIRFSYFEFLSTYRSF